MARTMKAKKKSKTKSKKKVKEKNVQPDNAMNENEIPEQQIDKSIVEKLMERAESCINSFEYELAEKFLRRVLEYEPNDVNALESLAAVLLELCNSEEANNILLKAVEICPASRHSIYFSLAQLNEGIDSLNYYRKGSEILERLLNNKQEIENDEEKSNLKRELSNAYCSIAEMYMTDCCFEEDAEQQCKNGIDRSIASDPTNPDSYQRLADFMLVKGEHEEAKVAMKKSLSLWLPQYQALQEGSLDLPSDNPVQFNSLSYESRINTSKLLIELEMFDEASEILDALVDENDEVVEVWYLLGWSNFLRGEDYWGNARYYLKKARKVESKTKSGNIDQMNHIDELLTELGSGDDDDDDSDANDNNKENGTCEIEDLLSESETEESMEQ